MICLALMSKFKVVKNNNWRPPTLSELTTIIFNMELTLLGSESSNLSIEKNKFINRFFQYHIDKNDKN